MLARLTVGYAPNRYLMEKIISILNELTQTMKVNCDGIYSC